MINRQSAAISILSTALVLIVLALAVGVGLATYQYVTKTNTVSTTTSFVTYGTTQTVTQTQNQSTTTITITQVATTTRFIVSSTSSQARNVVLSGVDFTDNGMQYALVNQQLTFPQNSTVTFIIMLYNYILDSSNSSMKNPPPLAHAVNGTGISQVTPQYWNFHVLGYSQVFNKSPRANSSWYQGDYLQGSDKGAVPNYGNDTLYVAVLLPSAPYNGFLTIRIF